MKIERISLAALVLLLPLLACDAPPEGGGDCQLLASNCGGGAKPDGCSCEGSNGASWECDYAEGSEENCCMDDENACMDE